MSDAVAAAAAPAAPAEAASAPAAIVEETAQAIESGEASEEQVAEASEQLDKDIKAEEKKINDLKKKLKLKVDGREIEEEFDFADDQKLTKMAQEAKAFQKRSQELATLRKQVEGLVAKLETNPFQVLQELGLDIDDLAKGHLEKRIEEMNKSPEEIEREKMRQELEAARKELEGQKKAAEEAQMEQLRNHFASEIEADINGALSSGKTVLPKSPLVVKRIAETMSLAMSKGFHDVTAKDVLPIVEEQFKSELKAMFGMLPEDTVEMLVGSDTIDKIRKKKIQAAKAKKTAAETKTAKNIAPETGKSSSGSEESEDKNKVNYRDFFGF